MNNGFKERCFSYLSGIVNPVYEQYKLKDDSKYARQRFSSLQSLSEHSLKPSIADYDWCGCGILSNSVSIEQMVEDVICIKNSQHRNSVSVGDVIKVFHLSHRYLYYVDSVGLKQLDVF